jgi:hypothetical protein
VSLGPPPVSSGQLSHWLDELESHVRIVTDEEGKIQALHPESVEHVVAEIREAWLNALAREAGE